MGDYLGRVTIEGVTYAISVDENAPDYAANVRPGALCDGQPVNTTLVATPVV